MTSTPAISPHPLLLPLRERGFAFVSGQVMVKALLQAGVMDDWDALSASWSALEVDTYMADHGRYRRRRHAVFTVGPGGDVLAQAPQPHYQSRDYNAVNGGVARWYTPMAPALRDGASMRTILALAQSLFDTMAGAAPRWHVEVHQFRIEAHRGNPGQPTPEGVHRDGVDYVLVLLVDRHNIDSGTTTIHRPDGALLGSFTLTHTFDAALVDDRRVRHGVTAVKPHDPAVPAWRDVLVVTFRRS